MMVTEIILAMFGFILGTVALGYKREWISMERPKAMNQDIQLVCQILIQLPLVHNTIIPMVNQIRGMYASILGTGAFGFRKVRISMEAILGIDQDFR